LAEIAEQLIDFIRTHISAIGGLTPARKLAAVERWFRGLAAAVRWILALRPYSL